MKRLTTAVLFLIAASFAPAQTTLTYTAPVGTLHCSNKVGSLPAVNHACPMGGFQGATGTQTGDFQTQVFGDGSVYVVYRISPGVFPYIETVFAFGRWNPTAPIPGPGVPLFFSFDAPVTDVCLEECNASTATVKATFHLEGEWAYQILRNRYGTFQEWKNTTPVVVTIVQTSGPIAILD